jgi:hypothetical protein
MRSSIVVDPTGFRLPTNQRRVILWTLYVGYLALVAGVFHGLAQALSYANIDILQYFPGLRGYYQGLTVHGVANVLIFTFSFSNGFLPLMVARSLSRPLVPSLLYASFASLVIGNLLTIYAVVSNQASVLYTSYAPLQAHWTYYVGLALVVVSTWLAIANMVVVVYSWRKQNSGARIPLLAYISLLSYAMWALASIPIAVSFLGILTPWTLGLIPLVDPLLTRTLFWFTGHAVVYAWLLPAYVSWYALVPRQAGGRIISDSYSRIVFILFLLLSIPTGFPSPVHRSGDPERDEGGARCAHLRRVLPQPGDGVLGNGSAGDRWESTRRDGSARVDPETALERPVAHGSAARHDHIRVRRNHGAHQREPLDEPGDPQHYLGTRSLPHDGGKRGSSDADRRGILDDPVPQRQSTLGPACRTGLFLDVHRSASSSSPGG